MPHNGDIINHNPLEMYFDHGSVEFSDLDQYEDNDLLVAREELRELVIRGHSNNVMLVSAMLLLDMDIRQRAADADIN